MNIENATKTEIPPTIVLQPQERHLREQYETKHMGYVDPKLVKKGCFYTLSGCLFASIVACILAVWGVANNDVFWRLVATFIIIGGGVLAFMFINGLFQRD